MKKLVMGIRSGGLAIVGLLVALVAFLYIFLDSATSPNPSVWPGWAMGGGVILMFAQFFIPEPPMS